MKYRRKDFTDDLELRLLEVTQDHSHRRERKDKRENSSTSIPDAPECMAAKKKRTFH